MSNTATNEHSPIVGYNGKRGKRVTWEEMDALMTHPTTIVTYSRSAESRDGKRETVTYCGRTYKNGGYEEWRVTARYAI